MISEVEQGPPPDSRPRPWVAAALSIAALAGACAPYVPRPIDLQLSAAAFEARRLDDERVHETLRAARPEHAEPWPPVEWDRADLLLAAWALSPRLAEERAALDAVRAGLASARARPEPGVTLLSEYSSQAAESSPWLLGLTLDLPLDGGRRRAARVESARLLSERALYDFGERLWATRDELARALDDWGLAERELALWNEIAIDRNEERRLVARQLELGAAARPELVRIESEALGDERRAAESARRLAEARSRAAHALGVPITALDGVRLAPFDFDPEAISGEVIERWRAEALLARNDLRAAVAGYALAEQQLRLEVARQYPEIRLGPGYIWERGVVKLPFDLSLALPLFQRNRGPIAEAEVRRTEAAVRLERAQAEVFAEIDRARGQSLLSNTALVRARGDSLAAAQHLESLAAAQVTAGALDRLGAIEARLGRRQAELALLAAESEARSAQRDLEVALRRPLDGPELALADWLRSSGSEPPEENRP